MTIINNKPNEFPIPPISIDNHSGWPSILIAPFTLKELERKNKKKKGTYIKRTMSISGWNTRTPINQKR